MANNKKKAKQFRHGLNVLSINGFFSLIVLFTLIYIFSSDKYIFLLYLEIIPALSNVIIRLGLKFLKNKSKIESWDKWIKNLSCVLAISYMILELVPKIESIWYRLALWGIIVVIILGAVSSFKRFLPNKKQYILTNIGEYINVIESFFFYLIIEILIFAVFVTILKKDWVNSNWIPMLTISIALAITVYEYWPILINVKAMLIYISFWIVVPIIVFGFYVQNRLVGGYNTFHFLFLIIAAIDSFVLVTLSSEIQTLTGKKINDINKLISTVKIILANITLLIAIATGIFEETRLQNYISGICSKFYWISKNLHLDSFINLNFKTNGKMTMFISIVLLFIGLLSYLLVHLEKMFSNWGISKLEKYGFIAIEGSFYDWLISHNCEYDKAWEVWTRNIKADKSFPKGDKDWKTIEVHLKKKKINCKTRKAIRTAYEKYEKEIKI